MVHASPPSYDTPVHTVLLDLKPENLLFRTKKEDADIMIADFGLSRVMEEEKFQLLTEICGTPGVSSYFTSKARAHIAFIVHGPGNLQEK